MGSQRDEDRFSRSTSDASIDAQALQPSADTGSQLQAMRSSSGTTEKGSKSRKTTNYDKDLEPTATGSPLSSDSPRKLKGAKPRRVRTGCFTCRERHLKCDEALHRCQNCRKSGRVCRRGVRLNFIDTQTVAPPYCIPRRSGSQVTIQDDSRLIASEYVGGFERYPPPAPISPPGQDSASPFEFPDGLGDDMLFESSIFMDDPFQSTFQPSQSGFPGILFNEQPSNHTSFPDQLISHTAFPSTEQVTHNYCSSRTFFNKSAETRFMQSFVEEVGCWMDLMDTANHFTQILPIRSAEDPMIMIKSVFMACGARHHYLVSPSNDEEEILALRDKSWQHLCDSLKSSDHDLTLCAAAAVVLDFCELMRPPIMPTMNNTATAPRLIKQCGWDGQTPGLGGSCFWLNVSLELLNCLRSNRTLSWNPDTWGVDMSSMREAPLEAVGDEELWIRRMVYICAKICNFRASSPQPVIKKRINYPELTQRCMGWTILHDWCDQWDRAVPRSLLPLSYILCPEGSTFPEIWLVKRSAILAQLFYHTALILLSKCHPMSPESSLEMKKWREIHAGDICAIVARMKDRGIANFPIWFFVIAAECLVSEEQQAEALQIVDGILKDNRFRAEHIKKGLREAWGWNVSRHQPIQTPDSGPPNGYSMLDSAQTTSMRRRVPPGTVNPMMTTADFSDGHSYRNYSVSLPGHMDNFRYGSY